MKNIIKILILLLFVTSCVKDKSNVENLIEIKTETKVEKTENNTNLPDNTKPEIKKEVVTNIGTIIESQGENYLKQKGKDDYKIIKTNDNIINGDEIKTTFSSKVKIKFIDNTEITIGSKSRFVVNNYLYDDSTKSRDVSLNLIEGRLKSIVSKITTQNSKFEIKTNTMVLGVRGTEFIVFAKNENETNIGVTEGEVEISNPKDKESKKIFLGKNKYTSLSFDASPVEPIELTKELMTRLKGDLDSVQNVAMLDNLQKEEGYAKIVDETGKVYKTSSVSVSKKTVVSRGKKDDSLDKAIDNAMADVDLAEDLKTQVTEEVKKSIETSKQEITTVEKGTGSSFGLSVKITSETTTSISSIEKMLAVPISKCYGVYQTSNASVFSELIIKVTITSAGNAERIIPSQKEPESFINCIKNALNLKKYPAQDNNYMIKIELKNK